MNKWILGNGKIVESVERPSGESYPLYPTSRVCGDRYTPYNGNSEWERASNTAMAEQARSNFQRRG
jgi:hypothetical protein